MLNRQKSLLHMIERAGRAVSHMELTKWAFLLAYETPSRGGAAFYQFLPYRLGPFSFCLYRESEALAGDGYLVDEDKAWRVAEEVERQTGTLPRPVREDVARIVEEFRNRASDELTAYVYRRFPWFTANSIVTKLHARPVAPVAVYTVGYERWLVDGFLDLLMRTGIQRIIDVRSNPVSRRFGFHGSILKRLSGKVSIDYVHYPQLGIPSELRRGMGTSADYAALFARYERNALRREAGAVETVAALMKQRPSALMCMEADPSQCHRSRLAKAVARATALPVRHLGEHDDETRF